MSVNLSNVSAAIAALKTGKLPTTDQLVAFLQATLKSDLLQPEAGSHFAKRVGGGGKLSSKGREVVVAEREVIEAIIRIGLEKNDDDKIQRFIHAVTQVEADVEIDGHLETPDIPLPTAAELKEARESLRDLLSVLLTSSELRALVVDGINLFRDLFADAAENVAQASIGTTKASKKLAKGVRPSEEEKKEKKVEWDGEVPSAKDVKKKALRGAEDVKDEAIRVAKEKVKQIKIYTDEDLPTDVKDAAIERFKAIIDEIQADPQYSRSIETLFGLIRKYTSLASTAVREAAASSTAKVTVETNGHVDTAATLFRSIVESFTGPLDDVFRTIDAVAKDLEHDQRIQSLFKQGNALIDRAINDPGYITSSRAQRRIEALYDQAQTIMKDHATWKKDIDALVTELNKAADKASNDKALVNFGNRLDRLAEVVARFGKTGLKLVGGSDVWGDLTQVFLPRLLAIVKEIPLPRVEYTSVDLDLALDGIKFTSLNFMPDASHFTSHLDVSTVKGYAAYATTVSASTTLSVSGLRLQAHDISYYINKKGGWVGLEDSGLLDVIIGGERDDADDGLDITIEVENAREEDRESFFVVKKVEVAVEGFRIKIHGSQHPVRNFLARPALRSYLESSFVQVLEEQIGVMFKSLDKNFYDLQQRSVGARLAAPDPLTYLRALLTPTGAPSFDTTSKGITKVGPKGEYILSIGVDEDLLPGKLTGLGEQGRDVVARKKQAESLMEEGERVLEEGQDVLDQVEEGVDRVVSDARRKEREEEARKGWKSKAFDLQ